VATPAPATFAQLLTQAVNEPGILSSAYRQFYGYSLGNPAPGVGAVHGARYSARTHRHAGRSWGGSFDGARKRSPSADPSP
jgi:hypothetical protein